MEKRNIQINLKTAQKWYNSNDESLKEIALQAFSKEELEPKLRWEDYKNESYRVYGDGKIVKVCDSTYYIDGYVTEGVSKRALAMAKLSKLCKMTEGWIENPECNTDRYVSDIFSDEVTISTYYNTKQRIQSKQFSIATVDDKC